MARNASSSSNYNHQSVMDSISPFAVNSQTMKIKEEGLFQRSKLRSQTSLKEENPAHSQRKITFNGTTKMQPPSPSPPLVVKSSHMIPEPAEHEDANSYGSLFDLPSEKVIGVRMKHARHGMTLSKDRSEGRSEGKMLSILPINVGDEKQFHIQRE